METSSLQDLGHFDNLLRNGREPVEEPEHVLKLFHRQFFLFCFFMFFIFGSFLHFFDFKMFLIFFHFFRRKSFFSSFFLVFLANMFYCSEASTVYTSPFCVKAIVRNTARSASTPAKPVENKPLPGSTTSVATSTQEERRSGRELISGAECTHSHRKARNSSQSLPC